MNTMFVCSQLSVMLWHKKISFSNCCVVFEARKFLTEIKAETYRKLHTAIKLHKQFWGELVPQY
jgi:hypothetical protein